MEEKLGTGIFMGHRIPHVAQSKPQTLMENMEPNKKRESTSTRG